jgi:pre-mRNA-splicing helicase BRR2
VDDLLAHCSADDTPDLFLKIESTDLQLHLDHINDKVLLETLTHGIGFYHEALDRHFTCFQGMIQFII